MAVTAPDDIADRWRVLSSDELSLATVLIADAESIVAARLPTFLDRIAAGTLDPVLVRSVVSRMVLRVMRNPDGKAQEAIDDYSYRRADAVADGSLYLSPEDLSLLAPSGGTGAAFTISPFSEPGYRTTPLDSFGWNV